MVGREEWERTCTLGGVQCRLHVSSGRWDDYLELELPASIPNAAATQSAIAGAPSVVDGVSLDWRMLDDSPPLLCLLADYSSAPSVREGTRAERVGYILEALTGTLPDLDLGDLLPGRPNRPSERAGGARPSEVPAESQATSWLGERVASVPESAPVSGQPPDLAQVNHGQARREASPMPVAELLVARAREQAASGLLHKALRTLDSALRCERACASALALRQAIKTLEGRDKRRRREPANAQAQLEAGFSYLSLGCFGEAAQAFAQARRLKRDLYLAHILYAVALHGGGLVAQARDAYEQAAMLNPHDNLPRELLASLARGEPPPLLAEEATGARRAERLLA